MIRAWGKDDPSAWDYSTDEVMRTLYDDWGTGGPRWARVSSTASTVTYRNKGGGTLVLTLDGGRVADGLTDAITGAAFS